MKDVKKGGKPDVLLKEIKSILGELKRYGMEDLGNVAECLRYKGIDMFRNHSVQSGN